MPLEDLHRESITATTRRSCFLCRVALDACQHSEALLGGGDLGAPGNSEGRSLASLLRPSHAGSRQRAAGDSGLTVELVNVGFLDPT